MRMTKTQLLKLNAALENSNSYYRSRITFLEADMKHLEKRLGEMHTFINRFGELPRAIHGATEALAHMLTDARQMYVSSPRRDRERL